MHENADIFRNLSETAIIFDHDLRIAACSNERAFASLFGQGQGVPALGASVLDLPVNIDLRELREEIEKLFMEDVPFARKSVGLKNAGEPRSLNLSFFPFTSRPWRGTNGVLLIEDATEHYRMFERLAEAEKFSALGSLTSMITHEINNPLDGVLRLVKLSLTRLESDSPAHTYLTEALKGLNRTLSLIRSILTFSRSGSPLGTRTSPLNAVIEAATEEVRRKYSDKEISVDLDLAPKNLSVSTDDFYMVISNLVSNAFDAIGSKSGSIRIETNVKDDRLYILVEDSGCGISDHVRPHIFSAFFTTKDYGEGAGLGLSIVKKIIDKYNGTVDVQSEMNLGTHMHITFPLNKLTS
jgi:signal transduction histidine kinase